MSNWKKKLTAAACRNLILFANFDDNCQFYTSIIKVIGSGTELGVLGFLKCDGHTQLGFAHPQITRDDLLDLHFWQTWLFSHNQPSVLTANLSKNCLLLLCLAPEGENNALEWHQQWAFKCRRLILQLRTLPSTLGTSWWNDYQFQASWSFREPEEVWRELQADLRKALRGEWHKSPATSVPWALTSQSDPCCFHLEQCVSEGKKERMNVASLHDWLMIIQDLLSSLAWRNTFANTMTLLISWLYLFIQSKFRRIQSNARWFRLCVS